MLFMTRLFWDMIVVRVVSSLMTLISFSVVCLLLLVLLRLLPWEIKLFKHVQSPLFAIQNIFRVLGLRPE